MVVGDGRYQRKGDDLFVIRQVCEGGGWCFFLGKERSFIEGGRSFFSLGLGYKSD